MRYTRTLATIVAAGLILSTSLLAQKTSFDYDKTADFTKFKTYSQKVGTLVGDPLIDKRLSDAIDVEMTAKGLTKNDTNPDVTVIYHIAFDKKQDISTYSFGGYYGPYGYGWGGGWGGGTTEVRVTEILVGTLMIDVAEVARKQLVYRGVGVKEVDTTAKAEKRDKNVSAAVKKILKNFPPPPPKKK